MTDPIEKAVKREQENRRVRIMEQSSWANGTFLCELCGERKADEKRREPESEICIDCVIEAGFGYE